MLSKIEIMYTVPPLPYAYDALEPWIDEQTMIIHHDKHHQTYVDNLNKTLEKHEGLQRMHGKELISHLDQIPPEIRTKVQNNLGGVLNHNLFWQIMCPENQSLNTRNQKLEIFTHIDKSFGSMDKFQQLLTAAALNRFGSGWAWLVLNDKDQLEVIDTPNQDSPLMQEKEPLLGIDVWEHAYYLKYQYRRAEYIRSWWNVVNWNEIENRYKESST